MKTTVTVGQSMQVLNIGQSEHWNKFGIERQYDSEVDELAIIDELVKLMELAHQKHSQSMVSAPSNDLYFNVTKNKEERG